MDKSLCDEHEFDNLESVCGATWWPKDLMSTMKFAHLLVRHEQVDASSLMLNRNQPQTMLD